MDFDIIIWLREYKILFFYGIIKNKETEEKNSGLPIVMCLGICIGTAIGAATDNMALWLPVGLCIGVSLGLALSDTNNKNDKK